MTRHGLRAFLTIGLAFVATVVGVMTTGAPPAAAADLTRFDPGYIISDQAFWASGTMSRSDVQHFLDQKGADCVPATGSTCLRGYTETTTSRATTERCAAYAGAAGESAAAIIVKVASACGINPQVLLVTLQKEQGLVTARTGKPAATYQKAMGFGCPDTAACDAKYYGFFNQVYSAASQFRNYAANPTRYAHQAGLVNNVRFHPDAGCGTSPVHIRNQATAGLYNYTPYQPNAASLAAGYGTGNACSSYGNRNFYAYFTDWFGSPVGSPPFGFLDSVTVSGQTVTATGWAIDPDTDDPITVHLYVGADARSFRADVSRPDVDAVYRRGDRHGYVAAMDAPPGRHEACAWALNTDATSGNTLLGCRSVDVPNPMRGVVDTVAPEASGVTVTGWAYDPDSPAISSTVRVTVDGVPTAVVADVPRVDVDAAYGVGAFHGFHVRVPAAPGPRTVCVVALKAAPGVDLTLGCRQVTVVNKDPHGWIDSVTTTATGITVTGWALDPDTDDPIAVHVYVDSASSAHLANGHRPDLSARFGRGPAHGFSVTVPATPGTHRLCVYAINATPGHNPQLECRTVEVRDSAPFGWIDSVEVTSTGVTVTGWAMDPDTAGPIDVHVYVDSAARAVRADRPRPDLVPVHANGADHGYTATVPTTPGQRRVCVYAINANAGPNTTVACFTVTVPDGTPFGFIDSVVPGSRSVTVTGWAIDPDTTGPIAVHVYVGAAGTAVVAGGDRPDLVPVFGRGPAHGFSATVPAAPGPQEVCVYAINTPSEPNPRLSCRTVTVSG
ncbi:hypothetical protein [Cellulomonas dongxiuzhuiae]|uniref:Hemagglutinin n=1 Tax=Cellulomonas dongxiuzhuiae TaxID=2819979 RepID=A0ABX8GH09_9CELL|nr:hypothetical protein [Cellulomonas dongxiuzhuiae]MBO3093940.1 hypothetical protein [Cellulomonas dongxiuzhuiae]QWC15022.1 hypothetical protein KKR89_11830 [Cellulomonas dongxiuzhuiae]